MKELVKKQESSGFTKEQLMKAKRFAEKRDALQVVLKKEEKYSIIQAQKLIEKFLQRKVR